MSKILDPIIKIAKYTFVDEVRQRSFIIMFVICALAILLFRGCYSSNFTVNGQTLDPEAMISVVSKALFHMIAVGAMLLAALLSMRVFRRDRDEGMQSCILSKPVTRWQYVAGKIAALWILSVIFMFVLHGIVFIMALVNLKIVMPNYLIASLLCSLNLLFVVVATLLFSLTMPDIISFLSVTGIAILSFAADGIFAMSRSAMGQMMMHRSDSQSDLSVWNVVYYLWPKISGTQRFASSLIGRGEMRDFWSFYPLINILVFALILTAILFWRFSQEDIV